MLRALASDPGTLIVFNHPAWDEHGIGQAKHMELATLFLGAHSEFIHAVELNGLRPWKENRLAWRMAQDMDKPIVAGGDRHALEPNTLLDLTNAGCFPNLWNKCAAAGRMCWSPANTASRSRCAFYRACKRLCRIMKRMLRMAALARPGVLPMRRRRGSSADGAGPGADSVRRFSF